LSLLTLITLPPPRSTLFPYTTLFRSLHEIDHSTRVIPTDGRPHIPQRIRQWQGDSVGHWDGNTLVVDTTNFTARSAFRGSGEKRSEEHTSELQSRGHLVCRLLLEKKN